MYIQSGTYQKKKNDDYLYGPGRYLEEKWTKKEEEGCWKLQIQTSL